MQRNKNYNHPPPPGPSAAVPNPSISPFPLFPAAELLCYILFSRQSTVVLLIILIVIMIVIIRNLVCFWRKIHGSRAPHRTVVRNFSNNSGSCARKLCTALTDRFLQQQTTIIQFDGFILRALTTVVRFVSFRVNNMRCRHNISNNTAISYPPAPRPYTCMRWRLRHPFNPAHAHGASVQKTTSANEKCPKGHI